METLPPDAMKKIHFGFAALLGLALLSALLGGCFGDDSAACEGSEGCNCYPNPAGNGLCETPLVCVLNVCKAVTGGSLPDASSQTDATVAHDSPVSTDGVSPSDGSHGTDVAQGTDAAQTMQDTGGAGTNLITNGDFSMGQTDWAIVSGTGTISTPTGQLCVSVASGQVAILGWPETPGAPNLPLTAGASYTLSYMAMATPAVIVDAKVGHTTSPYTADFETPTGSDAVTTSFTSFEHPFTAPTNPAETSAGVAFQIPQTGNAAAAEMVCFEMVSLVEN